MIVFVPSWGMGKEMIDIDIVVEVCEPINDIYVTINGTISIPVHRVRSVKPLSN